MSYPNSSRSHRLILASLLTISGFKLERVGEHIRPVKENNRSTSVEHALAGKACITIRNIIGKYGEETRIQVDQ